MHCPFMLALALFNGCVRTYVSLKVHLVCVCVCLWIIGEPREQLFGYDKLIENEPNSHTPHTLGWLPRRPIVVPSPNTPTTVCVRGSALLVYTKSSQPNQIASNNTQINITQLQQQVLLSRNGDGVENRQARQHIVVLNTIRYIYGR